MNPLHNLPPERGQQYFVDPVPLNRALGLRYVSSGIGHIVYDLPWQAELVGDPETGILQGGAITVMFDAACGGAIVSKLDEVCRLVTLDLRIDYLRPATPHKTVRCEAECHRVTKHIAWARATAYHDDISLPIATAIGSFMLMRDDPGSHILAAVDVAGRVT